MKTETRNSLCVAIALVILALCVVRVAYVASPKMDDDKKADMPPGYSMYYNVNSGRYSFSYPDGRMSLFTFSKRKYVEAMAWYDSEPDLQVKNPDSYDSSWRKMP